MINGINRIKRFGVFEDYTKPTDIDDFVEKNIIYGWNYSGKTTISRIFQSLELREIHKDFNDASFELSFSDGVTVTEQNVSTYPDEVRVFNTDFIKSNLSWDGDSFDPILLLGDESIEAEKTIKKNEEKIERCRVGYTTNKTRISTIEKTIKDAKTKKASNIKTTLSLVDTFTATHLNQILPTVEKFPKDYLKDKENHKTLLKKALASESDKLPKISDYVVTGNVSESLEGVSELLLKTPEMANTIKYLAENTNISQWVKDGLVLHEGKDTCEFCGNQLEAERLKVLKSHFSKDLRDHEVNINNKISIIENFKINFSQKHIKDFYPAYHTEVDVKHDELKEAIKEHNTQLQLMIESLSKKLKSQYTSINLPKINIDYDNDIKRIICELNSIITKNNSITNNFGDEKKAAISTLKRHSVAEFVIDENLLEQQKLQETLIKHRNKYENFSNTLQSENLVLEAQISNAQKGREELNKFIEKFLGDSNIRIEVIKAEEKERFILKRGGDRAQNLSEGEKTAIAFSFFLVKLGEINTLKEAIVYIDDPISSLDSNHLFQVNAVIKDFFFWQDAEKGNEWKLRVKQIFFSTHNFEFLSLLKELKLNENKTKYYLVKRISVGQSSFVNMPESIKKYSSEYHYLWDVIYSFYISENKDDIEILLSLPNAMRRFIELYTYSKIPSPSKTSVDSRASVLFGSEKSKRILKVLHHFSHLNNINRMMQNDDLMVDIENVVNDLVEYIRKDELHYNALMGGYTP